MYKLTARDRRRLRRINKEARETAKEEKKRRAAYAAPINKSYLVAD